MANLGHDAGGFAAHGLPGTDKLQTLWAGIKNSWAALETKWLDCLKGNLKAVVSTAAMEVCLALGKLRTYWRCSLPQWTFFTGILAGLIIRDLELFS